MGESSRSLLLPTPLARHPRYADMMDNKIYRALKSNNRSRVCRKKSAAWRKRRCAWFYARLSLLLLHRPLFTSFSLSLSRSLFSPFSTLLLASFIFIIRWARHRSRTRTTRKDSKRRKGKSRATKTDATNRHGGEGGRKKEKEGGGGRDGNNTGRAFF